MGPSIPRTQHNLGLYYNCIANFYFSLANQPSQLLFSYNFNVLEITNSVNLKPKNYFSDTYGTKKYIIHNVISQAKKENYMHYNSYYARSSLLYCAIVLRYYARPSLLYCPTVL